LVKESGTPFVFVLTQAKANARITIQTIAALSQHGQVFQSVVHDRVDYAASMTDGRTALELNPNSPAAAEIAELWVLTRKRIGELASISELANQKRVKVHA
jgi:chromosome partitioning protein